MNAAGRQLMAAYCCGAQIATSWSAPVKVANVVRAWIVPAIRREFPDLHTRAVLTQGTLWAGGIGAAGATRSSANTAK